MGRKKDNLKNQKVSGSNPATVRTRISDEEINKLDLAAQPKVLRSVARPNYCETAKRNRRTQHFYSNSFNENMCLELEVATGTECDSRSKSDSNIANTSTIVGKKMALTDSNDSFAAKDEDVSNQSFVPEIKARNLLNKSYLKKSTPPKCSESIKYEPQSAGLKNTQTPENQTCPICQKVLPDNHSFTIHIREHNASNNKESHVCQICLKKLSSASSLDRHMYVHSGERPFKCKICDLAFTTNGNMHRHMRTHSSGKRKLTFSGSEKSEDEEAVPSKKTVYRTSDDSNSQTFKCPVCNKRFISVESLEGHMDSHPNEAIQCWKCSTVSENYTAYKRHACIEDDEPKIEDVPKVENGCVVGFRDLNFIEFSAKKFSLIAKNACEEQVRRPSSASLAFECHACGKAFPCTRTLQQHEETHDAKVISACQLCEFPSNFTCVHLLKQETHAESQQQSSSSASAFDKDNFLAVLDLQKVATDSPKLVPQVKTENWSFEAHSSETNASDKELSIINMRHQSDNSNDFADITSIVSLTSKATLPSIRKSPVTATPASPENNGHNPESPIIEGSANSNFEGAFNENASSNLDSDSPNEGSNKGEKFQCRQCTNSFPTMKALRGHSRTHSQNGPHCCDFCNYKSVDKSTLLRHMRTHNGERPFKCSLCDYAFTTKANSHRHVKKKHKLPDDQIASAVVYNPNMLDSSSSENMSSENPGETVCKYCNVDFKFSRVLRHHLRSVNNSCARKPFACRNCNLGFSTKNNCIRHINQQHPDYKGSVQDLIVINQSSNNNQSQAQQASSSNTEASGTEEDEPPDLHIVDYESNNMNEEPSTQDDYNEQTNSSFNHPHEQHVEEQMETTNELINQNNENEQTQCSITQDSYNEILNDQHNSCSSEDDRVSIAQSLVSLSEGVTFQAAPLDLSVRAIDLSSKNTKQEKPEGTVSDSSFPTSFTKPSNAINTQPAHSSPNVSRMADHALNLDASPINLIQKNCNKAAACPQSPIATVPVIYLPQPITTSAPLILNNVPSSTLHISSSTSLPAKSDSIYPQTACMAQMKMVKKKLVSNEKSYKCEYCDGKFTLKSNRERHVKKQHPEYARPSRSRNFIPSLPEVEVLKQVQNVSDTTKNLLRSVLIPKVNSSSPNTKQSETENSESPAVRNESCCSSFCENFQNADRDEFMDTSSRNDYENNDLASVSSVIDTANSQVIKKYLTDANVSDLHSSPGKVVSSSESDIEDLSKVAKRFSTEKSRESLTCEYCKRSFPWVSALNRHMRTHTGAKPYRCLECPVNFSTKSNLDRHIKKKCCDKINYKYNKMMYNGFQTEQDSRWTAESWNSGSDSQADTEKQPNMLKNENNQETGDKQNSIAGNDLKTSIGDSLSAACFTTSLNTVAHVASLRLQCLDQTQAELECKLCQSTYNTDRDLTSHMKELHPLEYQSITGENTGKSKDTITTWKKYFDTKPRELEDECELSKIQPPSTKEENGCSNYDSESDPENNLIMNLLGVKDSKVIDEIIDCAARTRVDIKS